MGRCRIRRTYRRQRVRFVRSRGVSLNRSEVGSMCLIVRVLLSAVFEGVVWHDIPRDGNASLVSTGSSTIIQRIVRRCSNGALHASVYQRLTHS